MNVTATNEWYTVLNNQDFKTSFELILNDLFTCWNFRFVFDPRLNDLQLLELELIHFAFLFVCLFVCLFFMETNNTTIFGKSKSVKSPSLESKTCFDHRKSKVRLKQKSKLRWLIYKLYVQCWILPPNIWHIYICWLERQKCAWYTYINYRY